MTATLPFVDVACVEPEPSLREKGLHRVSLPATEVVLGRVRGLVRRRLAWLDHLGIRAPASAGLNARELEIGLDDHDSPEAQRRWLQSEPAVQALNREVDACTSALTRDENSNLARLRALFGLSPDDWDVLQVCLALELDPNLGPSYALLQRHPERAYATEALTARLVGSARGPLLSRASPLLRWEILQVSEGVPGVPSALRIDPHVLDFICDRPGVDPLLFECVSRISALEPLASWPVSALTSRIERALDHGAPVRVTIVGPRGSGRRTLAACVAEALGVQALAIDQSAISDADWPRLYLRAQRQALLLGMSPVWHGEGAARRRPAIPGVSSLEFVIAEADVTLPAEAGTVDERVVMPRLTIDERTALWRRFIPSSSTWSAAELTRTGERFRLEVGDLNAIARRGAVGPEEARALCRLATRDRLGDLGQLLDCPFTREDLVLSEALDQRLEELLFEARDRARFWESESARRLFPRGLGLVAMLAGPPGTGKTMTAQVVAAELGLDLFRIDLATSISKYIGETAKNLRRIFLRAEEMNAVLLFDEADALFSKRTEVRDSHDRYANTDTNYLLQLLESFSGIALLSSNKRENMDAAFVRRIRYILEFPRPAESERRKIWQRVMGELAGEDALSSLGPVIDRLANVVEMSGAQIKLAVLAALFAARKDGQPLQRSHLMHGITRELGKEGRGIGPKERERLERG